MKPTVLLISTHDDFHARALAAVLLRDHYVTPVILNTADFPLAIEGVFRSPGHAGGALRSTDGELDLVSVRSVWWRRPAPSHLPPDINSFDREFVQVECDHFMQGLLWSCRNCLWVNNPQSDRLAARKIVQLSEASAIGLPVPRTMITNDPVAARAFRDDVPGKVIFKRTGASPGPLSKTTFFTKASERRLNTIKTCPTIFQEYIEPRADIRVIWINGDTFAAAIDTPAAATPEDSRFDHTVAYARHALPLEVGAALDKLMVKLGLMFGAIDLRWGCDGKYYFLEVNPSGQFMYVELKTGLPVASALASLLARGQG